MSTLPRQDSWLKSPLKVSGICGSCWIWAKSAEQSKSSKYIYICFFAMLACSLRQNDSNNWPFLMAHCFCWRLRPKKIKDSLAAVVIGCPKGGNLFPSKHKWSIQWRVLDLYWGWRWRSLQAAELRLQFGSFVKICTMQLTWSMEGTCIPFAGCIPSTEHYFHLLDWMPLAETWF